MSGYSPHQEPQVQKMKAQGSVLITPLKPGTSSHFSSTTSAQRHYLPIGQPDSGGSSPSQTNSPKAITWQRPAGAGFQCSIPKPCSTPATVPLCLPGSHRASSLLQKGPLSSGARRLTNEFLARHEESSGMLIVCWRISKRFGEIYTDFHVTATEVAQTLPFLYMGVEGGGCPCVCGVRK